MLNDNKVATSSSNGHMPIPQTPKKRDTTPAPKSLDALTTLLAANRQGQVARVTVWIGPELAQEMLGRNHPKNRAVSMPTLRRYIREHEQSRFHYTPAPLVVDGNGTLGDGQHRLSMVAQTGQPLLADIVQMFDQDAFERARLVVDTGRTRTRGHVLEIAGLVPTGKGVTANGILSRIGYFHAEVDPTRSNLEQVAMFRPWANAIGKALGLGRRWNLAMRSAAAVAFKHNPTAAEELFKQFDTNIDLKPGMPSHALIQMSTMFNTGRGKTHETEVMLFVLKACHKQFVGATMRQSKSSVYGYSTRPSANALEYFFGSYLREEWREKCARLRRSGNQE
jgi:hypothetical protein